MTIIEKTCKHCYKQFHFEYEPKGKGSGNQLRKKYCSIECLKNSYKIRKKLKLSSRIEKKCIICNGSFFVPLSLISKKMCSNECRHQFQSIKLQKFKLLKINCLKCQTEFEIKENSNRKFCSSKCFYQFQTNQHVIICEICNKQWSTKKSATPRFCSKACTFEAQSKGLIASHINGRSGFRTDIVDSPYFKSSFEADYYRYCSQILNVVPVYEKKTFRVEIDGLEKCYTPDFWFENTDTYVELKGVRECSSNFSKLLNSNSIKREKLISQGIKIDVIYMQDFYLDLKQRCLFDLISNLEHKNYAKTKHLIVKHSKN